MRLLSRAALTTGVILSLTLAPVPPGGATPLPAATDAPSGAAVGGAETQRPVAGHRPRARRDVYRVTEDRTLRVRPRGVLRNDRDDRHRLRAKKVTGPREGRARLSRRGGLTYTPDRDFVGIDALTYAAVDRTRRSDRATVVLRVRPVNDAPSFTAGTDQAVPPLAVPTSVPGWASSVSPGPADESGQDVTFLVDVVQGSALFSEAPRVDRDGTLHFTPSLLSSGTAVLDVVARDDGGTRRGGLDRSAPQRLEITVLAPDQVVVVPELTTLLEGAETLLGVVTAGLPGELTYRFDCDGDGTFESGDLTDPEHGCLFPDDGTFSPEVEVVDGLGQVHAAVTEVVVENVAPVLTLPEGGSATEQLSALLSLGSFTDPGTDGPWDVLVEWGDGTTDTFTSPTGSLGTLAHTWNLDDPDLEYVVTVTVTEAGGTASDTGTFVVDLLPVNDPPSVLDHDLSTTLLEPVVVSVADLLDGATDPDGDPLSVTSLTGPAGLTLTPGAGVWTLLPTLALGPGPAELTYTVSDGHGGTDTGTLTLDVLPALEVVLTGATAADEGETVPFEAVTTGLTGPLTYRFDCDGDGTFESGDLTDPEHGCLFPDDGTFSPEVEVVDDLGTHRDTLDVVVDNVAPVLTMPGAGSATEQLSALLSLGSFTDPGTDGPWDVLVEWGDGTTDTFTSPTGSLGTLAHTWNLDDPDLEYVVTVTVTEAGGTASDTGTFVVDLLPVNDPPVAGACPLTAPLLQTTQVESSLLACASDPEGDPLTITAVSGPLGLGVVEVAGVWSVLPTLLGLLDLDWTVSDGSLTDDGTAAVTVS